uniref:Uncharacterized protein n=1 Tax=Anguilla anguilla TaxID=7936 RepID=A0A0E9V8C1_ANGAN
MGDAPSRQGPRSHFPVVSGSNAIGIGALNLPLGSVRVPRLSPNSPSSISQYTVLGCVT